MSESVEEAADCLDYLCGEVRGRVMCTIGLSV